MHCAQTTLKTAGLSIVMSIAVLCCHTALLNAQGNADVELISTDDGLSQGNIQDLLQDREGFLWIATVDGLNRYDGYNFKVFTNDPDDPWSISGNSVNLLFEDSHGRIWAVSGNSGINIYDKETGRFHHIRHDPGDPTSLSDNHIVYIVEDTSGTFVLGVAEQEINLLNLDESFFDLQQMPHIVRLPLPPQKESGQYLRTLLKGIVQDARGRVWVGGQDVIYRLDVQNMKLELVNEGYSIGTAITSPDGVWSCGASQPLFFWNGDQAWTVSQELNQAYDMRIDARDNLWLLRLDSLFGIDLAGWQPGMPIDRNSGRCAFRWSPTPQPGEFPLRSMTVDRSGIVWAGANGHGLYKINPHRSLLAHSVPGISVRQIAVFSESEYCVQSYGGPWFNAEGGAPFVEFLGIDLNTDAIDRIAQDQSGAFWLRHPDLHDGDFQLRRYDKNAGLTAQYSIDWMHYEFQPMIVASDGSVWMAGFNDILTHVDPESSTVTNYNLADGSVAEEAWINQRLLSHDFSTALHEDTNGALWVGTERGITKCTRPSAVGKSLQVTSYRNVPGDNSSLSYNHVMCILDDPLEPGRFLWVCTKGGGINRFDKESGVFMRLGREDGLPDNVVYGMLTDAAGNLWGSTNKGIFCMTRANGADAGEVPMYTFRNFTRADGLQDNEFNTGAYAKMPDGRLMFGGINGLNVFDPEQVLANDFEPEVYITGLSVNNETVMPGDESGVLAQSIESAGTITLTHRQDIVTLEFASLDFRAPAQNKFRYQLIGADNNWVEAGNRRFATFLHLRPGQYTFRVQGSNSRGIWSSQIAELGIRVLPPWWATWWAYALYAILVATGIWTYLRISINRARLRQQLDFEKLEAERVKELDSLKTRLFMNMTHEFRTPLTIILGMAQQVLDNPQEHFRDGMTMIKRNGENLLSLVNKMLNLSKLESGKMTLDLVQGDVILFLRNIVESFRSFAAKKEIHLHFLPEIDAVVMDFDQDKLQQVVANLLSNAFKFTPRGGNIYFSVRLDSSDLSIRVKDTGCGIPAKDQPRIFDRFYQVDDGTTREYEGTGIGLALSKELVLLMEGEISVASPPAGSKVGSEFRVSLPIRRNVAIGTAVPPVINVSGIADDSADNGVSHGRQKPLEIQEVAGKDLILLVEDNADVVAYVASCLSGYRLAVAQNGKEGLEMAIELIPDIVISDVMMPVMDGFALCRNLKSDDRTNHIPVVMLTARADIDSKLEGLELGANAYLPKPYEKQELLLTLKNLFDLRESLQRRYQHLAGSATGTAEDPERAKDDREDPFVTKVRETITAHIDDSDFNVEQLAGALHLSHSQFGRKLQAVTGLSPNQFIRSIRLGKAHELLRQADLSITAIAFDCGFSDPSYFSRVFRKEFGTTPVEWRELNSTTPPQPEAPHPT